ncbi:MAG: error-prone DNA polymerase [Thermoanaerobaculia bacterium]|nr:error-prone DNA polymerase [Thermoanaerobaculia bacterium]
MSDDASPTPPRDFGYTLEYLKTSPGARKEKARQRTYRAAKRSGRYAELHVASAFSFLDGASQPEDLVARAAALGLPAVALVDRSGVYGAPRFYKAAREAGIRALVGAEVVLADRGGPPTGKKSKTTRREAAARALEGRRLTLLVRSREGYRNLCKLLTAAARGRPKGDARVDYRLLQEHVAGLHCLTGGDEGLVAHRLATRGMDGARKLLKHLRRLFSGHVHVELQRHRLRSEEQRNRALAELATSLRLPLVATNGVRYATPGDKPLHDVLTCTRHYTHIDAAGRKLAAQRERHLKSSEEMERLFADIPWAVEESLALAQQLDFTLADLGYQFPDYPLPEGETDASFLRQITWNEARVRFRPLTARAQRQIEKELDIIEKLDLAGYFLIVWDIVQFCKREDIMVQGRGSAANSAVCYALSITAIDPVKMELLFERFLSEERGEWPDIDLDLPSGDPREKVIQYVYRRYGPHGAAMTANVITYRDKLAAREVGKALGYSTEQVNQLSKRLGRMRYDTSRGDDRDLHEELRAAGFDPEEMRVRHFVELWARIKNLPRHLGQHSGGMVMCQGRLDEVVPLEPASMEGRVVVQWDKDDCADLGIIKVDLLGLGMLNVLEEAAPVIEQHENKHVDYAHLPQDDPVVYDLLQKADTVGVFQVESRAQMASLPRNRPERFYDLVIQVAIIRPGPIVGGMVHPYFERRQGRQSVEYLHPSLEPILKRTLGVPLFQEQLLRMAMVAAGFSGGEAEELRRAMGFKRSMERMGSIEERLRAGMDERGITGPVQDQVVQSITSFALYGFPESHAASFALIAYASAWLKAHHPTAFLLSLLNAWPMGFYHPATLVKDSQRHGVKVRPVDVTKSDWRCTWEPRGSELETGDDRRAPLIDRRTHEKSPRTPPAGSVRIGLRYVRGLEEDTGRQIEEERRKRPFRDLDDLALRCCLDKDQLDRLAWAGALAGLGMERREAAWQVARVARDPGPLFRWQSGERGAPLRPMTALENTVADFQGTSLTVGHHPMVYARARLRRQGVVTCAELERVPAGRIVRYAGSVVVRQRPGTAKGMLFVTLEDETGMAQAMVTPDLLAKYRDVIVGAAGLVIQGRLQRRDGSMSIKAESVWPIDHLDEEAGKEPDRRSDPRPAPDGQGETSFLRVPSHDWH